MTCQCDNCRMKGYLHIPTGIIFYNLNMDAILSHGVFKSIFPEWYEEAFDRLDDSILNRDSAFISAKHDWETDGVHRLSRQASILSHLPGGYIPGNIIGAYCLEYLERCQSNLMIE